jgi:hypothetical protein
MKQCILGHPLVHDHYVTQHELIKGPFITLLASK